MNKLQMFLTEEASEKINSICEYIYSQQKKIESLEKEKALFDCNMSIKDDMLEHLTKSRNELSKKIENLIKKQREFLDRYEINKEKYKQQMQARINELEALITAKEQQLSERERQLTYKDKRIYTLQSQIEQSKQDEQQGCPKWYGLIAVVEQCRKEGKRPRRRRPV